MNRDTYILLLMMAALTVIVFVAAFLVVESMSFGYAPDATPSVNVSGSVVLP